MKKIHVLSSATCVALVLGCSFTTTSFAQSTTVIPESATPGIANFTDLGEASPNDTLNVNFYLQLQNKEQLYKVLGSHQKLTPEEFHAQFSPNGNNYHAVVNQLQNAGLTVNGTTDNNLLIDASGTVAEIESVLGTDIHLFQDSNGKTFLANTTDYHVTGPLANNLAGTTGVNQLATPGNMIKSTEGTNITIGQKPISFFNGNNSAKIQQAYNFTPVYKSGLDGAGQTIAIVDAYGSPTIQSDLQTFNQKVEQGAFGANEPLNLEVISPPPGLAKQPVDSTVAADWAGETSMDVELAHAVAPGAKILLVETKDNQSSSLFIAVNKLIDKKMANQISLSWGAPEEYISTSQKHAVNQMFAQAAAEGVNVFVSSGDNGDFSTQLGNTDVSFPASDPNVIAVGGSSLFTNSDNSYQNEFLWGDTFRTARGILQPKPQFWLGTGGGVSNVFAKPIWQTGVQGLDRSISHRQVPDVAFNSDPLTGFSIVQNGVVQDGWGGTSDAAPQWAAISALANQGHMQKTGSPLPFINPLLYSMNSSSFHDVQGVQDSDNFIYTYWATPPNSNLPKIYTVWMGHDTSLQAGPGWDDATGLGTPDVSKVVNNLINSN